MLDFKNLVKYFIHLNTNHYFDFINFFNEVTLYYLIFIKEFFNKNNYIIKCEHSLIINKLSKQIIITYSDIITYLAF